MATHSSILAWEILWTEEPGGLQSTGLQRIRHNLVTKQQKDKYLFQWYGLTHGICTLMILWVKLKESNTLNFSIILQSFKKHIFIYLFGCAESQLQHVGCSSPTRDRLPAPCLRSAESQPLDHQRSTLYRVLTVGSANVSGISSVMVCIVFPQIHMLKLQPSM